MGKKDVYLDEKGNPIPTGNQGWNSKSLVCNYIRIGLRSGILCLDDTPAAIRAKHKVLWDINLPSFRSALNRQKQLLGLKAWFR